tara:strand:+ start:908 stop:1636 length:729 start_codon:yes stop_codon:yes gene_type:complete
MARKTILNYSPNFNSKKRVKKTIKFIIIHYTGMKRESDAIDRLTNIQSEVSSHYLIKNNGDIMCLVPDLYIAWHAGKSTWKNFNSLNKNSIGIEMSNPGHQFNYKKFSKKQITSLTTLIKKLSKRYEINYKNILGHSDIAPERKKDPGEKFPWEFLSKNKIALWHSLNKEKLKKLRKIKIDLKMQNLFIKNISKIGYQKIKGKKRDKSKIFIIKAFQRRFRQELVNGKIDLECLMISKSVIN